MASARALLVCSLAVLAGVVADAAEISPCDVNPFRGTIEEDGEILGTIFVSVGAGFPKAARHEVRSGVCSTFMVVNGTVLGLEPVAVVNAEGTVHTLMTVEVRRSWKATAEGVQHVRLVENLWQPYDDPLNYPLFAEGDECLLYLVPDSYEELVAYPSLAIRDSVILGLWGVTQQISREDVFALVDSCTADRSLGSLVCRADLIIEGNVESSWEDWSGLLSESRTACSVTLDELEVHKGSFPDSLFTLVNVRGYSGWNSWPTFDDGERVVLFLEDDRMATHRLVGGWQGKWHWDDAGTFRIGRRSAHARFGVVSLDAPLRPSRAPVREFSRLQLEEALARAAHTLSN